jgi:wobble nucleotide-excising tRNase
MIQRINKIKNLGLVFPDYTCNPSLPIFKHRNIIYGWNGSGKTTLSNLFQVVEDGNIANMPELEYEIMDEKGKKFKQGGFLGQKIRVFNQNYIENNLKIREGRAKSITMILGGVNKEIVEQIEGDEKEIKEKNDELNKINEELDQKTKIKGKTFTEIAKTIYVAMTGGAIRTYRKDNAESDFANIANKELLSDQDLEKYMLVVKQTSKPAINAIGKIEIPDNEGKSKDLEEIAQDFIKKVGELLAQTVESKIIEKLKNNRDISDWVENGIDIHEKHKTANCEFCGQVLPEGRLAELTQHFNDADKKMKQNIDESISKFSQILQSINSIAYPDQARFYDELQKKYQDACLEFDKEKTKLIKAIGKIIEILKDKKSKTTESVNLDESIDTKIIIDLVNKISEFIEAHNKKTSDFENEKNIAINKLKFHFLSTIFDEVKKIEQDISDCKEKNRKLNEGDLSSPQDIGLKALKKRINENRSKISSTHKACDDINKGLETFLGRSELFFEPNKKKIADENGQQKELDDGYIIKRGNKLADNLSEGEKTAIAFVYFTIHLKDKNFDLKNGIVVIDDPISSLDSNSLFQAFAFLKNAVKNAGQVFIFTHNFDFLKLLLNWAKNANHGRDSEYFMLKNCCENNCRSAYIDKMDKELSEYESEYHYLFKILNEFESDGTIAQAYPIPNIARKVLDTFLMFRMPCGGGTYLKLEKMKETTDFDENKLTAIYKFTNDQSHITGSGFNPALVPETQKNVKYLLEMIDSVFPEHYKILSESIK